MFSELIFLHKEAFTSREPDFLIAIYFDSRESECWDSFVFFPDSKQSAANSRILYHSNQNEIMLNPNFILGVFSLSCVCILVVVWKLQHTLASHK